MIQKAYLALGCFWGPDEYFSHLPGVISTRVGYSGGKKDNPTYHDLGDQSETIEIRFDAEKISYAEILKNFFSQHDPGTPKITQYRSAIFYLDEEQKKMAEDAKNTLEKKSGNILTSVEPFGKFYPAEEYHQKYLAKSHARGKSCAC